MVGQGEDFVDKRSQSHEHEGEMKFVQRESVPDIEIDDPFAERWKEIVPQGNFGSYVVTECSIKERNEYQQWMLGQSSSEEHQIPFPPAYVVLANERPLDPKAAELWDNHRPEKISHILQELKEFKQQSFDSASPLAAEYIRKADELILYCQQFEHLGSSGFTGLQMSEQQWREFIDLDATLNDGELILKYEKRAAAILSSERPQPQFSTVGEAIGSVLSPEETGQLNLSSEELASKELSHVKYVLLIQIIGKRLGLFGDHLPANLQWELIESKTAAVTNVMGEKRQIIIPTDATLEADKIHIPFHELMHALGSHNGLILGSPLLQSGLSGYGATEEGFAQLAEMLAGQHYGHLRQRLMAARYMAIAMSLKASVLEDGQVVPKYSMQEVYQKLLEWGLSEKLAKSLVWRIQRGTSLHHKGLTLSLDGETLPIAETYAKDAIYFEGQISVYEYLLQAFGFERSDIEKLYSHQSFDLSSHGAVRVIRKLFIGAVGEVEEQFPPFDKIVDRLKSRYHDLSLGQPPQEMIDQLQSFYTAFMTKISQQGDLSVSSELRRQLYELASNTGKELLMMLAQQFRRGKLRIDTPISNPSLWAALPPAESPEFVKITDMFPNITDTIADQDL